MHCSDMTCTGKRSEKDGHMRVGSHDWATLLYSRNYKQLS